MRRPFILFFLLLAMYCWLKDLTGIFFYLLHTPFINAVGTIAGISGVLLTLYLAKSIVFKNTGSFSSFSRELFQTDRRKEWLLLLLVSSPIILLGAFRSIYPDEGSDTLHFELYLQDFAFPENKVNYAVGSIRTFYFPLPERIFSLFRHALGFRMGAIVNTLLLLTLVASVYDFIKKFLSLYMPVIRYPAIGPALLSVFVITADNTLFNIGSYKPDLLGIPFIMELLFIVMLEKGPRTRKEHLYFFFVTSLILALKLTYLPYIGILGLIYYYQQWKSFKPAEKILLPLSVLLIPGIYCLYIFHETGSPIFPFYNTIFRSPLYPDVNFKDARFGPRNFGEIFIYPIVTLLDNSRCNEYWIYSYRLLFGYFFTWGTVVYCLLQWKKNRSALLRALLSLSLLALAFDYSCILTTGYYRYGIIIEVVYGIIMVLWLVHRPAKWVGAVLLLLMAFQFYDSFRNIYVKNRNLSWHDYRTMWHYKTLLRRNLAMVFHDYPGAAVKDTDGILPRIDAFIGLEPWAHDSYAYQLKRNTPIYDIQYAGRTSDSVRKFEKDKVRPLTENKIVGQMVTIEGMINQQIGVMNSRGYMVSEIHVIYPPFLKSGEPLYFLRVRSVDTSRYVIKYTEKVLKDNHPPATGDKFAYETRNKMTSFVLELPYTFDFTDLPKNYDITVNGDRYLVTDRFKNNRIFASDSSSLTFTRNTPIPFIVIIQELEERRKKL